MNISGSIQQIRDDVHLHVFEAGTLRIPAGSWKFAGIHSSFWRLYRNTRGAAHLSLDGDLFPLEPGRVYLIPAGLHFAGENTEEMEHFYIHFDILGLQSLEMRSLFIPLLCPARAEALEVEIAALSAVFATASPAHLDCVCRIKAALYAVFAHHLKHLPPERQERERQRATVRGPILPALEHIEQSLSRNPPNATLAALCALSEDYFIERFRQCMGLSPSRYVQERRVTRAAQLLLFTPRTIEDIAAALGFGNRYYFSRVFKQHTGISPAAYRRRRERAP